MVSELLKMCLPLNHFLARALSVQILGGLPQERDDVLLETKVALSGILKVFSNHPNVLPLLEIQRDLCRILLMNTNLETMDVLLRVNTLVSYGLEHLPDLENMPMEIFEFITTVVTQEEIRKKILSFLCILAKAMADRESNVYLEHLFKLDEALSKILAEKEEDNKLDSLCGLTFLLTEFMVTDYPDDNTEWIVQLNHFASRAMVDKFEDPKHLLRANNILSQAMRKLADKPFFGELIELDCILSSVFLLEKTEPKYNQLIGWKLLLTLVMQQVLVDENAKHFKKSARETEKEETELARISTKLALVTQDRDEIRAKAREMRKEVVGLVKERAQFKKEILELLKDNINLNAENRAMKREQMEDERVEGKENIPPLPDVLEKAIPEEGRKESEEGEKLKEEPEEKSEEKPSVQQLINEEMKGEGEVVTEAIAGASVGERIVTKEVAGPSKVQGNGLAFKQKNLKKKGAGGGTAVMKNPGPGSSRGQRSKKK